tara:strand:- start:83 stop:1369 length:1287 start_codon:yes stop_codon:yes gene_type:complete
MKKLLLISALLIFACSSDSEGNDCIYEPTLSTEAVTDITETSATLNGIIAILSENCDVPNNAEQGFVYSTEIQPTIDDTQVNVNGTNISTTIEGLTPNTTYYVRSFLTNALGEFYGNEVEFTTNILDTTPPVITIIGDNPLEINIGENYTEFGATAIDDIDGDITQDIIIDSSNINTTLVGSYVVTYSVADSSNNLTVEVRVVIVIDNSVLFNCDGNPVPTIVYGNQEWTVENACYITYRDGTPIPEVTDNVEWSTLTTGAWAYYNNDTTKPRLYNWYAVMGIHDTDPNTPNKEFAPENWHVPSYSEWTTLELHLVTNGYNYDGTPPEENRIAKAMASTTGWISSANDGAPGNDQSSNNSSGFNAFPEGGRDEDALFTYESDDTFFWSSTESADTSRARGRGLYSGGVSPIGYSVIKQNGFSVRLVKD